MIRVIIDTEGHKRIEREMNQKRRKEEILYTEALYMKVFRGSWDSSIS